MTRDQRSPIIELPLSITLTDEGEYFFNQNNRILEHLKGRSSGDPSKIVLSTYSAKILQRLIYAGYISAPVGFTTVELVKDPVLQM